MSRSRSSKAVDLIDLEDYDPLEDEKLSAAEAAEMVGLSARRIYELANAGSIPHIRIDGKILFPLEPLRRWYKSKLRGPGITEPSPVTAQTARASSARVKLVPHDWS